MLNTTRALPNAAWVQVKGQYTGVSKPTLDMSHGQDPFAAEAEI